MKTTHKHNLRRIICVLLSIIMLSSLCSVMAAGEGIRRYENYVCIGDSVAAGSRLFGWATDYYGSGQFVEGSYPTIIRDSIANNGVNLARKGFRIREFLMVLDGSVPGDDLTYTYMPAPDWGGVESIEEMLSEREHFVDSIKNADLITIDLGSNEVFLKLIDFSKKELTGMFSSNAAVVAQIDEAADNDDPVQALADLLALAQKLGVYAKLLTTVVTLIEEGLLEFGFHWNMLLRKIYALNPDVEVVAVSMYNPMNSYINYLPQDLMIQVLYELVENTFSRMNTIMQSVNPYSLCYRYADITALNIGRSIDFLHPDANGHAYIADQIFAVLPKTIPAPIVMPKLNRSSVTFSWYGLKGISRYKVYRAVYPYKDFAEIDEVTTTSYTDNTTAAGISYAYKVRAVDAAGNKGELSLPVILMRYSILEMLRNLRRFR